ncbi:hypothetical protein NEMBOFW57_003865 [Staphylotrichum longicolle]|uniref:Ankyrin repeat protein n=1 Tax=Staphylotrichum longicolle TaxID=669026 RepID=A0AAD4I670_9PEZI|nr:hypothetical protein NEMBOFW57_003865 [Staphylotrichum longicolle]
MASPLELLPQELLDQITGLLDLTDVFQLGECSDLLCAYSLSTAGDRLVSVSSLHLAAKRGNARVFACLLRLGARVDGCKLTARQGWALVDSICAPRQNDFAFPFLQAGLGSQLSPGLRDELLFGLLRTGTATDLMDGPRLDRVVKLPLHIPLYALAYAGAAKDEVDIVDRLQLCVDAGADVNHRAAVAIRGLPCYRHDRFLYTTPFLFYLNSIKSWKPEAPSRHEAIIHWFKENGASILPDPVPEVPTSITEKGFKQISPPSPVQLLLDKWGVEKCATPSFLDTLELLISLGGLPPQTTGTLIAKYDVPFDAHLPDAVLSAWTSLIASLPQHPTLDLNLTLWEYIVAKGTASSETDSTPIGALSYPTIDALLAAGADINWLPPDGMHNNNITAGRTALLELCAAYHDLERNHWGQLGAPRRAPPRRGPRKELVRFLLGRGADPGVRWRGKTAAQVLEDGGWWWWLSGWDKKEGRELLGGLAEMMKERERELKREGGR